MRRLASHHSETAQADEVRKHASQEPYTSGSFNMQGGRFMTLRGLIGDDDYVFTYAKQHRKLKIGPATLGALEEVKIAWYSIFGPLITF